MSKSLLRFTLLLTLLTTVVRAQYVYIPDSAFRAFLISDGYAPAFNGDSLDTASVYVTSAQSLSPSGFGIQSLEGVQYFDNLRVLDCRVNYLTELPSLPVTLQSLICEKNMFTTLPALPANLIDLWCGHNVLYNLPSLPQHLMQLLCHNNELSVLPVLPPTLVSLLCDSNYIQNLPILPANLQSLSCSYNIIDSLPPIPASLNSLYCEENNISNLPALPNSLSTLCVSANPLYHFPALPSQLRQFRCNFTFIDSLPALPDSLDGLSAVGNYLTFLPPLPQSLVTLWASGNLLTSLPPSLPAGLTALEIESNQISSLPPLPSGLLTFNCGHNRIHSIPALPSTLIWFYCHDDSLTSLPPLPARITLLVCENNLLQEIPPLPDSMSYLDIRYNPLHCLPPISYISHQFDWSYTQISCFPNVIRVDQNCFPSIDTVPLCQPSSGCPTYWNISGNIYHDLNSDCIKDTNEQELKNIPVLLDSAGTLQQICLTNANGDYSFRTGLGNYRVRINPTNLPIPYLCPATGSYTSQLTPADSMDANRDFALTCPNAFDLYAGGVAPETMFRPTRLVKVLINAGDLFGHFGTACFTDTGFVQCNFNGPISYVGPAAGALTPTFTPPGSLRWNVNDFSIIDPSTAFNIEVRVDSFAMINDPICFNLSIYPFIGDIFPLDNATAACYPVRVAVDPNEKYMYPSGNVDTSDHVFNFTIFFQNTGNAPAEDIYIIDTLDTDLDASTFEFVSSTHPVVTQMLPGNILRFNYHGINLVDSVSNESLSHGNVHFRIHRKSNTGMGTEITNTAHIYFDLNAPVATNEVYAIVTSLVNVPILKEQTAFVYPNPASEQITIRTNGENILSTEIVSLTGQSIAYLKGSNRSEMQIDLKSYLPGIYFAKVKTQSGGVVCRFIKGEN